MAQMRWANQAAAQWLVRRLAGVVNPGGDDAFGRLVEQHFPDDAAMRQLARIVRGADAPERFDVMPESPGLRAMLDGFVALHGAEKAGFERADPIFEALLVSLRRRLAAGERLESDPLFDPASRLPNRLLLLDRLTQAIAYARRHDTLIAVCAIRFDFTPVEDHIGRIVAEIADRLRHTVRELDTIARLAVDEFGVAITDLRQREFADVAIRKIGDILSEPFDIDTRAWELVPRIGVSFYPAHGHDAPMLVAAAREAVPEHAAVAVFGEPRALS